MYAGLRLVILLWAGDTPSVTSPAGQFMCRHWEGPMSISILANDSEVAKLLKFISNSPVISSRRNIGYHMVYKEGKYYPANPMRAVALENARAPYVFFNDTTPIPELNRRKLTY